MTRWYPAFQEWMELTQVVSPMLVCIGCGRLPDDIAHKAEGLSVVWVDANPEIQLGNLDRLVSKAGVQLLTTTVSADGQRHPFYRNNFDRLDGLLPVQSGQTRYLNLHRGSDAAVETSSLSGLLDSLNEGPIALVLDVNGGALNMLETLSPAILRRIAWLAVEMPPNDVFVSSDAPASLALWAQQSGFLPVRLLRDPVSDSLCWIAVSDSLLKVRQQQFEHETARILTEAQQQVADVQDQARGEKSRLLGEVAALGAERDRLHSRLSVLQAEHQQLQLKFRRECFALEQQLELALLYRQHLATEMEVCEIELELAEAAQDTLSQVSYSLTIERSRLQAQLEDMQTTLARTRQELSQVATSDQSRQQMADMEIVKAQAQIGLLKDVMLGRVIS